MGRMFDSPLVILLTCYTGLGLTGIAASVVGGSIYDLKEAKARHNIMQHPYSKQNQQKPLITILIYADDEHMRLADSLASIRQASYRNFEIIIVDDTSHTNTNLKHEVQVYANRYRKTVVRELVRRKKTSREQAISAGLKKWSRGEIIFIMDAGDVIDKYALRNIARHFINENTTSLIPNCQIKPYPTILNVYQQLRQLIAESTKKMASEMGTLQYNAKTSVVVFRRQSGAPKQNANHSAIKYASNVMVYIVSAKSWAQVLRTSHSKRIESKEKANSMSYKKIITKPSFNNQTIPRSIYSLLVTIMAQIMIIAAPFVITYLLYLTVYFKQSALFGLSWIIFTVVLTAALWSKEYISTNKKLHLSFFIPSMYIIFYITAIIQLPARLIMLPSRVKKTLSF